MPSSLNLRDVNDERLRPVFVVPPPRFLGDEVGRDLAVGRTDREQFDAAGLLWCAAFVGVTTAGNLRELASRDYTAPHAGRTPANRSAELRPATRQRLSPGLSGAPSRTRTDTRRILRTVDALPATRRNASLDIAKLQ